MYQIRTIFIYFFIIYHNTFHTSLISLNTNLLIILNSCYQARALKCLKVISVLFFKKLHLLRITNRVPFLVSNAKWKFCFNFKDEIFFASPNWHFCIKSVRVKPTSMCTYSNSIEIMWYGNCGAMYIREDHCKLKFIVNFYKLA